MRHRTTISRLPSFLLAGIICLGLFSTLFFLKTSSGVVKASGNLPGGLHVVGNQIQDKNGNSIVPHGVDRMGTEYQCTKSGTTGFDGPVDQASVNAMLTWNVNIVRVPLNEDCWLGINGFPANGKSASQYQSDIVNWVNLLNQNGILAIVELHWNAPGSQQATGQEPMTDLDHAPAFWTSVSNTFKTNTSVLFDLYNEPYTSSWSCWKNGSTSANSSPCTDVGFAVAGMQTLVNSVRATGASNIIMLGGLAYSNDLSQWMSYKPNDSQNNLVASAHIYSNNACANTSCWNSEYGSIHATLPVLIGELGEYDCADGFINPLMSWLDSQHIGYLAWTWTATGNCGGSPALVSDYAGTPTGFGQGYKAHITTLPGFPGGTGSGTTVTDPLNDFSFIYAHSANLTFDGTNTQNFNNDNSRLNRTTTTAEWAIWQLSNMTRFQADTYFWPGQTGVNDFQFFASPNTTAYTQITPQITNLGGDWTHIQYTLNLPAGTNYVKVVFPTNATNAWDPQIAQVTINGSGTSTPTPTPTSTPTNTPTPTPTTTPVTGASCRISYAISNQWTNGFSANVIITNTSTTAINGWTLVFSFPNNQQVTNGWNGTFTQQAAQVSVTNLSYNGSIAAGGNTSIGFNASFTGNNTNPTTFTLNGSACTIA